MADDPIDEARPSAEQGPLLTRDDLVLRHPTTPATPVDRRLGTALLVVVLALGALLAAAFVHTDVQAIADAGWRSNALWAGAVAMALVGLALGVLTWSIASSPADSVLARAAVLAAVVGVVVAVITLGVADEQGGRLATSTAVPAAVGAAPAADAEGATSTPEPPLELNEALEVENLTSVAFPVTERTLVSLELTSAGREMISRAMGCRPRDLAENLVYGTIVGGTWVQPLVIVGPPVREDESLVGRCRRVATRLPVAAGFAVPRF